MYGGICRLNVDDDTAINLPITWPKPFNRRQGSYCPLLRPRAPLTPRHTYRCCNAVDVPQTVHYREGRGVELHRKVHLDSARTVATGRCGPFLFSQGARVDDRGVLLQVGSEVVPGVVPPLVCDLAPVSHAGDVRSPQKALVGGADPRSPYLARQ